MKLNKQCFIDRYDEYITKKTRMVILAMLNLFTIGSTIYRELPVVGAEAIS